jgi:hypothetical protein
MPFEHVGSFLSEDPPQSPISEEIMMSTCSDFGKTRYTHGMLIRDVPYLDCPSSKLISGTHNQTTGSG